MHCPTCDAANPDTHRFCERCGASFTQACPACSYACGLNAKFCGGCGIALERRDGALVAKPQASPASDAWGELKQATVLFADIVGSTEHIAALDPEQAMEHLRPVIHRMCDSVEQFGGTVIRTLGDGVMALFGVPKSLEGHAVLACEAALSLQAVFSHARGGLQVRVGLHSGQVASDPHDAKGGRGGGAHGLTIHLASRVVALAQPGGVCLTGATKALVGNTCQLRPMGEFPLKGIMGLTPVFELLRMTERQPDTASDNWLTPFHGRALEMDILQAALARTRTGDARVVGISAEPGGGKTRLCQEFVQHCRGQGLRVCEVRAQLYGHATPLQPILELLRGFYFGMAAADTPDIARTRIAQRLQALQASADDVELVCEFLGVAAPDAAASTLTPRAKHQRMLELLRLLVRDDAGASAVLLLEDLHWLDEASEAFVAALVEAVAGTHTLVVMNYRPHYTPTWAQAPHCTQLDLPDLAAADMNSLVAGLLGARPELAEVCKLVVARSAGNPFFAEELARTLIDSALLADLEGGLPPGRLEQIERALPATVQAVIGAKVDQLGEPEKTLLQMCAIIGKEIPMAVIEQVASHLRQVLEQGLAGLREAGLILQQSHAGHRQFVFRHPIIQEVTYSMQLKVRRVVLHGTVAQVMEAYYRDRLDEFAGLIAYHYGVAEMPVQAATFEAKAAHWIGVSDSGQALKRWRRVHGLLQGQGRSPDVDRLRVMLGWHIGNLGWREGMSPSSVVPIIQEAIEHAHAVDAKLVQLLHIGQGRAHWGGGGSADEYVAHVQRASAMVELSDIGRRATLNAFLCQALAWAGYTNEALAANTAALADVDAIDCSDHAYIGFDVGHWLLGLRFRLLTRLARFDEMAACAESLTAILDSTRDPVIKMVVHFTLTESGYFSHDLELASHHSSALAEIAKHHQSPYLGVYSQFCLGLSDAASGRNDHAVERFASALALIRESKVAPEFEAELLSHQALCLSRSRSLDLAISVAEQAVEVAEKRGNRFAECFGLIVMGQALAERDGVDDPVAISRLRRATVLLAVTGAEVLKGLRRSVVD